MTAVVAKEDDDSIMHQLIVFECFQDFTNVGVHGVKHGHDECAFVVGLIGVFGECFFGRLKGAMDRIEWHVAEEGAVFVFINEACSMVAELVG